MNILKRIFRGKSSVSNDPEWDALAARAHPPITVEQHRAAVARIQAQQAKVVEFVLPDGELVRSAAGAIDVRDIQLAQGYTYVIVGYDRFGWPMGHPDSPRGCFPNWGSGFEDILPALIEKWRAYRDVNWSEDD